MTSDDDMRANDSGYGTEIECASVWLILISKATAGLFALDN